MKQIGNYVNWYIQGISRCNFNFKFPTILILALLLFLTFVDFTPGALKIVSGTASFFITLMLATVKI